MYNYRSFIVTNAMEIVIKLAVYIYIYPYTYTYICMCTYMYLFICIILCQQPNVFMLNENCKIAIRSHCICRPASSGEGLLVLTGWLVAATGPEWWPLAAITCIRKYMYTTCNNGSHCSNALGTRTTQIILSNKNNNLIVHQQTQQVTIIAVCRRISLFCDAFPLTGSDGSGRRHSHLATIGSRLVGCKCDVSNCTANAL